MPSNREPMQRVPCRQPTDWVAAWEVAAEKAGMNLSEWIGESCNAALPKRVQKTLSERAGRGRPKMGSDTETSDAGGEG